MRWSVEVYQLMEMVTYNINVEQLAVMHITQSKQIKIYVYKKYGGEIWRDCFLVAYKP